MLRCVIQPSDGAWGFAVRQVELGLFELCAPARLSAARARRSSHGVAHSRRAYRLRPAARPPSIQLTSQPKEPRMQRTDIPPTCDPGPVLDVAPREVQRVAVKFDINGMTRTFDVEPWTTLLDLLRETCRLTGTHKGCDHGQCGACTAIVDGQRINTCLALAAVYDGASITTIEGLAQGDTLHPMQQAFIDHDAFQCGYCTPGQICSAVAALAEGELHSRDEIREAMSGNLCRCGAYVNIVAAIEEVAGLPESSSERNAEARQESKHERTQKGARA
jgi:xanthine dehydrogenase YagT iron-sulfur-binding subunit